MIEFSRMYHFLAGSSSGLDLSTMISIKFVLIDCGMRLFKLPCNHNWRVRKLAELVIRFAIKMIQFLCWDGFVSNNDFYKCKGGGKER